MTLVDSSGVGVKINLTSTCEAKGICPSQASLLFIA